MRTALLTLVLGLFGFNLSAQSNKYFGVRAQLGGVLSETSATISTKGGLGGGIDFAYMYILNNQWDIMLDGTFSIFNLKSNERNFDFSGQTWTKIGERNINFMMPEMTFIFNKSFAKKRQFKSGFGIFLSKNFQKTPNSEQAYYWGNAPKIEDNYAINNDFLTSMNYGLCLESGAHLGIFDVSARYKYGLANINTEGVAWRQNYLQLGITYFWGAKGRMDLGMT